MFSPLTVKSALGDYTVRNIDSLDDIVTLMNQPNTFTVIDSLVETLYPSLKRANNIPVLAKEETKEFNGNDVSHILSRLFLKGVNTHSTIIVIGGGILQDIGGFVASILGRGVKYILVPTTLLAMADSCVGGKTSLNFNGKKNLIGTFYPPKEILIYTKFVETLKSTDYYGGMGEIFKFGVLQKNIIPFDEMIRIPVTKLVYDSLKYKISILNEDEFDKGLRRILNFGHTFGHALEVTSDYQISHGFAVTIGCMISTEISTALGYGTQYEDIMKNAKMLLSHSNFILNKEWFDFDNLMTIVKSDKKSNGKLTMALMSNLNNPAIEDVEDLTIVKQSVENVYESIRLRYSVS